MRMQYISRLREELQAGAPQCTPLRSIFVGGGTPSVLTVAEWEHIFAAVQESFTLASDVEWTCEANPESLTPELIECWAAHGVNRVSIGVQAFQSHLRETIGRRGTLQNLPALVKCLRDNGIQRLNFDLIFNIPGQTTADWQETLSRALDFGPTHLSCYALTLEEGTRLAQQLPPLSDELFLELWDMTDRLCAQTNLRRYEISNFAVPGEECQHNYRIWKGATYLGCGPAAASFNGVNRFTNPSSLADWLRRVPPEIDAIPPEQRAAEILATGMRTLDGWSWNDFLQATSFDARSLRSDAIQRLHQLGLIQLSPNGMRPTRQGLLFNDDLAMELL